MPRPLSLIAKDIRENWTRKGGIPSVNYAAEPYLVAMEELDSINDHYYADTARSVVAYFLANANAFRGVIARQIKEELKGMLS